MTKIKPPAIKPATNDPMIAKALKAAVKQKPQTKAIEPKTKRKRVWAVDFDGTLCKSNFPGIGKPNTDLIEALKWVQGKDVILILWTSRTGSYLDEAVDWCRGQGLEFDYVNENTAEVLASYGNSRKIVADLYIDDRAFPWWGNGKQGDICKLLKNISNGF